MANELTPTSQISSSRIPRGLLIITPALIVFLVVVAAGHWATGPQHLQWEQRSPAHGPPLNDASAPLGYYFWDYGLIMEQSQLKDVQVHIPFEQGPPQKLLGRVLLFKNGDHQPLLEVHGRRPRKLTVPRPFHWPSVEAVVAAPVLWQLVYEAGGQPSLWDPSSWPSPLMVSRAPDDSEELHVVGTPWTQGQLRLVMVAADGSLYQVRCGTEHHPCPFTEGLRSAQWSNSSHHIRRQWTQRKIKSQLQQLTAHPQDDSIKTSLQLYLASLITLDPRDTQAYFHLGMLTPRRDTLQAMIRYGQAVGLEPEKLLELQARFDSLAP